MQVGWCKPSILRALDKNAPHIWSSVTLYNEDIIKKEIIGLMNG